MTAADAKSSPIPGIRRPEGGTEWDGIYGFVELRDGQIWAFGGTAHMGLAESFIRRVDRLRAEELFRADNTDSRQDEPGAAVPPRPVRPEVPITQIVEEPDGNLLVFAYDEVYRVDPKFARWTKIHQLRIGYRAGRPDAVGDYPSLTAVHRLDGDRLLCSTAVDGLVLIDGDRETHATLPGQLGVERVSRIEATVAGTLVAGQGDESPLWRFAAGAWREVDFDPGREGQPPTLAPVPLAAGGRAVRVRATLPWGDGDLLLATDEGLRRFDRRAGTLGPAPVPEPGRDVERLARDGLGRLWLAGAGLWMLAPGAAAPESLGPVPMIGQGGCGALAADPDRPDGIIAGLGDRGVVFLRVARP